MNDADVRPSKADRLNEVLSVLLRTTNDHPSRVKRRGSVRGCERHRTSVLSLRRLSRSCFSDSSGRCQSESSEHREIFERSNRVTIRPVGGVAGFRNGRPAIGHVTDAFEPTGIRMKFITKCPDYVVPKSGTERARSPDVATTVTSVIRLRPRRIRFGRRRE